MQKFVETLERFSSVDPTGSVVDVLEAAKDFDLCD